MDALGTSTSPLGVVFAVLLGATALAALAVVGCAIAAAVTRLRAHRRPTAAVTRLAPPVATAPAVEERSVVVLPLGAEAALNAITELRPDPRNVVVTHRDPTGEVRLRPFPRSA